MPKITFYRQARMDGGIRTGVDIDGSSVLGRFEIRGDEADPVLKWYVDVRCEGRKLPTRPEEARHWLLGHAALISGGLLALAEEIRAGIDFNTWPLLWDVPGAPRGVRVKVACCASRRSDGLAMADVLRDIAARWRDWVTNLPALEAVAP